MTSTNLGIVGTIVDRSTPSVVRGADSFITTQLVYKGTDTPYSFDTFAGATANFAADGVETPISVVGVLESADLGRVKFTIPAASTAQLAVGEEQSFEQRFADASGSRIILFDAALTVADALF
jgi:hypothetical protein